MKLCQNVLYPILLLFKQNNYLLNMNTLLCDPYASLFLILYYCYYSLSKFSCRISSHS